MNNHPRNLSLFLLLVSMMLTACGEEPREAGEPGVVPNSLQSIEAAAEDIIDFAPSGNWDKISTDVTDIEKAWDSYLPQADKDGASQELRNAMTSALADLKQASISKDASATMQGSNNVSAAVVELFALYNPNVPADIGRLDVLERQLILDVTARNYSAAEKSLAKTKSIWEQVKPSVLKRNGKDVAAKFEASLAAQESALTSEDDTTLTGKAREGLEIVDALEQLY